MIIIPGAVLVLLFCLGIEFLLKNRWHKAVLNFALIAAISIAVFRSALDIGGTVERFDNARKVADTFEFLEDSIRSDSLAEVRSKLSIFRQELPQAIRLGEPTTPMLLKALEGQPSTNNVYEGDGRK